VGVMMGTWFLASAYSGYVAHKIGQLAAVPTVDGSITDIGLALERFAGLFDQLLWIGLAAGAVVLVLSPLLKRLMFGVR